MMTPINRVSFGRPRVAPPAQCGPQSLQLPVRIHFPHRFSGDEGFPRRETRSTKSLWIFLSQPHAEGLVKLYPLARR